MVFFSEKVGFSESRVGPSWRFQANTYHDLPTITADDWIYEVKQTPYLLNCS